MKRYASHLLFIPGYGYLKQHAIEIEEACVVRIFPLTEEIENTEWLSGSIVLFPQKEADAPFPDKCQNELPVIPSEIEHELPSRIPVLFFPFDFKAMKPFAETQRKRLL